MSFTSQRGVVRGLGRLLLHLEAELLVLGREQPRDAEVLLRVARLVIDRHRDPGRLLGGELAHRVDVLALGEAARVEHHQPVRGEELRGRPRLVLGDLDVDRRDPEPGELLVGGCAEVDREVLQLQVAVAAPELDRLGRVALDRLVLAHAGVARRPAGHGLPRRAVPGRPLQPQDVRGDRVGP
jgi:hypothetical protein